MEKVTVKKGGRRKRSGRSRCTRMRENRRWTGTARASASQSGRPCTCRRPLRRATAPWADNLSESFSTAVFGELRGFWVLVNRPDASGWSG